MCSSAQTESTDIHTNSVRLLIAGKKYEEGDVDFEVISDSFKADKMYA